ncbi:MAG: hypothetical protein IJF18_00035 [Oscillospiraceae bacterium]|nr:hypothetical protein [Oscillospiraceae bacterium]
MAKVTVKRIAKVTAQDTEQQKVKAVTEKVKADNEQVTHKITSEREFIESFEKLTPAQKYSLEQTIKGCEAGTLSTDPTQTYLFAGERIGEYNAYELAYDAITDDYLEAYVCLEEIDAISQAANCYCDTNYDIEGAEIVISSIYRAIRKLTKAAREYMDDGDNKLLSIKRPRTVKAS